MAQPPLMLLRLPLLCLRLVCCPRPPIQPPLLLLRRLLLAPCRLLLVCLGLNRAQEVQHAKAARRQAKLQGAGRAKAE